MNLRNVACCRAIELNSFNDIVSTWFEEKNTREIYKGSSYHLERYVMIDMFIIDFIFFILGFDEKKKTNKSKNYLNMLEASCSRRIVIFEKIRDWKHTAFK